MPVLRDNYAYLVLAGGRAAVVDPSQAEPVLAALEANGAVLEAIWNTHHHWDHTGGNEELARRTGCAVYGAASDRGRIPAQTEDLRAGDALRLGPFAARVIENPGHTSGALSFFGAGCLFTGDTLFLAGCGRLFEGSPAQMWESLLRLRALPAETLVYCGHEYTEANLRFARHLEPEREALAAREQAVQALRRQGRPTVPAPLSVERETNPFLRADDPGLIAALARHHGIEVAPGAPAFAAIRAAKDAF